MPILYIRDELNQEWLPVVSELGAIPNVTFPNGVTDGQVLVYNSGSGVWTAGSGGGTTGSGGGDMYKSVYDQDNDGIVDNSERLGNQLPSYYSVFGHTHSGSDLSYVNATIIDGRAIDLTDVPTDGQALVWNNSVSKWQYTTVQSGSGGGNATQLQGRDISDSAPGDLQYLGWNNGTSKWEPKTISVTAGSDATKIWSRNISSAAPNNNDVLKWNSGASQWEPGAGGTSGSYTESQKIITFRLPGELYVGQTSAKILFPYTSGSIRFTRALTMLQVSYGGYGPYVTVRRYGVSSLNSSPVELITFLGGGQHSEVNSNYGYFYQGDWSLGFALDVVVFEAGGADMTVTLVGTGTGLST